MERNSDPIITLQSEVILNKPYDYFINVALEDSYRTPPFLNSD